MGRWRSAREMSGPVTAADAPLVGAGSGRADAHRRGHREPRLAGRLAHRPARAPAARPPHRGGLVLRRPHGPGGGHRGVRRRHRTAPAHGPADRHVAAGRRDPAPRQPRLRAAHPPGPAEPDDRRPRRVARGGAHRPATGATSTACSCGWPSRRRPGTRPPRSSTTPSCPCSTSTAGPPPCSSATLGGAVVPGPARHRPRGRRGGRARRRRDRSRWTRRWEHALVPLAGTASVDGTPSSPGTSSTSGRGATRSGSSTTEGATALLIGGAPFEEPVLMWWNFVARTRTEVDQARDDWMAGDGRFGDVASHLARIPVGPPPWSASQEPPR